MPIIECGFKSGDRISGADALQHYGPIIEVDIGFDATYDYSNVRAAPASQVSKIPALLDTGASESCIDDALAQTIGLPIIDEQKVSGIGGETDVNIYLGHIHIPGLKFTQWGRFAGVLLKKGNQPHQALIGRSLLQNTILIYDGFFGKVSLAI